ncbi:hypothetical protein GLE_2219 [Lysobacter enzymogenes]|uniref:Uncharacterized protein n=1 Tax=Lysobacter enzymogenes TaxID=69 RepID=A0A0S2DGJ9_LYSEN|nr:hypothetical protein [Lysobacter enzymogenes]ALN57568.1 hypothetical protein GLE_2219 [Lysobacter enzymogenes]QCW26146.1 hypothetical protein FE772_11170 [Lysobacter enzymogenes]
MKWKHRLSSALVVIFSAGWLLPTWLGVAVYLDFWRAEVLPQLHGTPAGNSFPFLEFARECFAWGLGWLAAVIAFWAYLGYAAVLRSRTQAAARRD